MTPRKPITDPPDAPALLRYVSGESTLAEADWIRRWAAADPDREASIAELRAAWEQGAGGEGGTAGVGRRPATTWDSSALWGRIEAELGTDAAPAAGTSVHRARGRIPLAHRPARRERSAARYAGYAIAASLVVAAGVTAAHYWQLDGQRAAAAGASSMREVVTARGEMATLSLADGSTVTLAPGSTVRVPSERGAGPRDATLDGEAVFTVKHDATRPFRVRTRKGITQDVGTRFMVRAYADDSVEVVVVADGAVSVRRRQSASAARMPGNAPITLRAGDIASLAPSGAIDVRHGVHVSRYLSWTARRLVFTGTPMPDVARVLGRWYDLDVRIDDKVAARALTADFSIESVPEMLRLLEVALDARAVQHGRIVTLYAH